MNLYVLLAGVVPEQTHQVAEAARGRDGHGQAAAGGGRGPSRGGSRGGPRMI
jgi:hypothetical protein